MRSFPSPPTNKTGWVWQQNTTTADISTHRTYPKISVVTSSYNQGQYIEETIRSVLLQNYPNIEYIIIDGGSTDNTVDILKKYEPWITHWVSEKDKGCPDALNKGLSMCTGDYFYYLNSDDFLHENAFLKAADFIDKHPEFDVYYGHGNSFDEMLNTNYKIYSSLWSLKRYVLGRVTLVQQGTFIKLNKLKNENIIFDIKNKTCWDGELWVDLALKGATFLRMPLSFNLATFRLHQNSITGGQTDANAREYQLQLKRIYERIYQIYPTFKSKRKTTAILFEIFFDFELVCRKVLSKLSF